MVTAGKVFKLAESTPLSDLASRLSGYKREEPYEEGDYKFTLITEIVRLMPRGNTLTVVYSYDYVTQAFHRGKTIPLPRTVEALFSFAQREDRAFLTVVEKKKIANSIANKLSETIYERVGHILEARIPPESLRDFHMKNPEDTKITFLTMWTFLT